MLNVPELERRWKRYRRSKQIPYIVTGVVASLLGAGVLVYLLMPASQTVEPAVYQAKTSSAPLPETPPAVVTAAAKPATPPQLQPVRQSSLPAVASAPAAAAPEATQEHSALQAAASSRRPEPESPKRASAAQTVKLAPSMSFMQDFESDVMQYYFEDTSSSASPVQNTLPVSRTLETQPQPGLPAIRSQAVTSAPPPVVNVETVPPARPAPSAAPAKSQSKQMLIQRENDMKDIQDVISRFKKNKNPALSLFVAKRYYRIGSYQQAYNYALITNELDSDIEDSWLIFAKSLYKLDQKEMAIKTLKTYYDESGSIKAKITLDQMEKGTLE